MLVGFNHNLYNRSTPIGVCETAIDLPYVIIITSTKKNLLPHRGDNSPLSIEQDYKFWMAVHDVDNNCISKKYIHSEYWVILMKSRKALIYESLQEYTNQYFGNLSYVMFTLEKKWKKYLTNDALDINMIIPKDNSISDENQISVADTTYTM